MFFNTFIVTYNKTIFVFSLEFCIQNLIICLIGVWFFCVFCKNLQVIVYLRFFICYFFFFCFVLLISFPDQLIQKFEILPTISSFFYCDSLSLLFILMSLFIFFLNYIYINRDLALSIKPLLLITSFTEILVLLCFSVRNLLVFYVCFELLLIPMLLFILLYGSRGRRIWASSLFFIYTFASSLFLVLIIFLVYYYFGTLNFDHFLHMEKLILTPTSANVNILTFLFIFAWLSFSIKLPTIPLHLWLPEAHVEAPTIGSVILAAILLKLGSFGILRVVVPLSHDISMSCRVFVIMFCVLSVFYSGMLAYRHFDLKKIIAYSSILHMNLAIISCLTESKICLIGCIISMLCHSLISAGLFFAAGFFYEKFKTRNLLYYVSTTNTSSYFYLLIFILILANMSIPFTISFPSEIALYCGFFYSNFYLFVLLIFTLFFSGLFSFMLIYRIIYFNNPFNIVLMLFSSQHSIYISPLTHQNILTFTYTELFILTILIIQIVLFFFLPDLFIGQIINYINII